MQTLHSVTEFLYILSRWSIMSCTLQSAFEEGCYLLGEGSTLVSDIHFQCQIYTLIFHKKSMTSVWIFLLEQLPLCTVHDEKMRQNKVLTHYTRFFISLFAICLLGYLVNILIRVVFVHTTRAFETEN